MTIFAGMILKPFPQVRSYPYPYPYPCPYPCPDPYWRGRAYRSSS